jgi:hypothetical protein
VDDVGPEGEDHKKGIDESGESSCGIDGAVETDGEISGDREGDERENVEGEGLGRRSGCPVPRSAGVGEVAHEKRRVIDRLHEDDRENPLLEGQALVAGEVAWNVEVEGGGDDVVADERQSREGVKGQKEDGK